MNDAIPGCLVFDYTQVIPSQATFCLGFVRVILKPFGVAVKAWLRVLHPMALIDTFGHGELPGDPSAVYGENHSANVYLFKRTLIVNIVCSFRSN